MVGPLGIVVSPFRPTSQIEGRGPHHHVEAASSLVVKALNGIASTFEWLDW